MNGNVFQVNRDFAWWLSPCMSCATSATSFLVMRWIQKTWTCELDWLAALRCFLQNNNTVWHMTTRMYSKHFKKLSTWGETRGYRVHFVIYWPCLVMWRCHDMNMQTGKHISNLGYRSFSAFTRKCARFSLVGLVQQRGDSFRGNGLTKIGLKVWKASSILY